jgi:hypothetical protein
MSEKSILEQALLQVQTLEEAVKSNAKGILASTMKQELGDLLKESMEDEEKDVKEQPTPKEDPTDDVSDKSDDETGDDKSDEDDDNVSNDDEPTKGIDDKDSFEDDDDDMGNMGGFQDDDDDDVVDMTGADEDEILKVFKAMGPEDGVIVKKDDDHIELSDGDDEYIIKLGDEDMMGDEFDLNEMDELEPGMEPVDGDSEFSEDYSEEGSDDETIYEIELDDVEEDMMSDDELMLGDEPTGDESLEEYVDETYEEGDEPIEGDVEESARTMGNGYHGGIKSKKKFYSGNKREEINEEVSKLRKQNDEYKKALVLFKEKLNEVAVFNANLAYATRLFTEHSTTKQEKLNILKRFDSISTLKESKNLYSSIKTELDTKKPVTESVVEKITTAPTTSSSQKVLSESKAYENPQFKRMKDLMSKIK